MLALLTAGVVFAVGGLGRADAAATGRALCATASGEVVRRPDCLVGERTLAAGTYKTRALPERLLKFGHNRMPKPRAAVADGGREGEPPVVELSATEMFQSSLYAFTVRYEVPENWTGQIVGSCPDYAPTYVASSVYSPEWQPLVDSDRSPGGELIHGGPFGLSGWRKLQLLRSQDSLNYYMEVAALWGWSISPAAPFTLYVTQVCGSIVALTPSG